MNKSTLYQNIEMGYRDAMVILAPMIIEIMKGQPIEDAVSRTREKNMNLFLRNGVVR